MNLDQPHPEPELGALFAWYAEEEGEPATRAETAKFLDVVIACNIILIAAVYFAVQLIRAGLS